MKSLLRFQRSYGFAYEMEIIQQNSLIYRATKAIAISASTEEILDYIDFLPVSVLVLLYNFLSPIRLRRLEKQQKRRARNLTTTEDTEKQAIWKKKLIEKEKYQKFHVHARHHHHHHRRYEYGNSLGMSKKLSYLSKPLVDYRRIFWEQEFREILHLHACHFAVEGEGINVHASEAVLCTDVVQTIKLHGREMVPPNFHLIGLLDCLVKLQLHHPEQKQMCWNSLKNVLMTVKTLQQFGIFYGRIKEQKLEFLVDTLLDREKKLGLDCAITSLEFVSIKIQNKSLTSLVRLFKDSCALKSCRISNCISDFDDQNLLLDAAFGQAKTLERLSIEHNDLEDNAVKGIPRAILIRHMQCPLTLRYLNLSHNAFTEMASKALTQAFLSGHMPFLEELCMMSNVDMGDIGLDTLIPFLVNNQQLKHLDISNCNLSYKSGAKILKTLETNNTLTYLDMSQNFYGDKFGEQLALFLAQNTTLKSLHLNYVGLGMAGCISGLINALKSNITLQRISLGANRLRDQGSCAMFGAAISGIQNLEAVDLSGNLITSSGVSQMVQMVEGNDGKSRSSRSPKRRRLNTDLETNNGFVLLDELSLVNNNFEKDITPELDILRRFVGHVYTNEWSAKRNVYDDEV